jgi:hypothetical protein
MRKRIEQMEEVAPPSLELNSQSMAEADAKDDCHDDYISPNLP